MNDLNIGQIFFPSFSFAVVICFGKEKIISSEKKVMLS